MNTNAFADFRKRLTDNIGRVIVGKDAVIEQVIVCLIAGGHILLEDVPGTGKTMLLRAFAKSIGTSFKRIQFSPDLMPSDLTGINFYNQKEGEFVFRKGPLFANLILADELNRATPRTQSALLEVMEEKQITVDGVSYRLDEPYMVMATQNPLESYGTFPLPEAQLDRFFMRLRLGYMNRDQEIAVMQRTDSRVLVDELPQVVTAEEIAALRGAYPEVRVMPEVANYIMDIIERARINDMLINGVSTRASIALYRASQIYAALNGRDYVIPEDVKREARAVLPHRVMLVNSVHLNNDRFIENVLEETEVPLEKI